MAHGDDEVLAVIESMNGARFVHDTLELEGWSVEVADARKVKGLARKLAEAIWHTLTKHEPFAPYVDTNTRKLAA